MDGLELKKTVETLLFITDQPLDAARLCAALGEKDAGAVAAAVSELQREYAERGSAVQLIEIAEGFQMATRPEYAPFVRNLYKERMTMRLSTAALETLAIIGYRQPLTRAEIEEIRGVEVIAALETLLEKALVKVVGRRESVGRPLLYGTTPEFLRHFGLRSLADLPPVESFVPAEATEAEKAALAEAESAAPATAAAEAPAAEPAPAEEAPAADEPPADPEGHAAAGGEPEETGAR